MQATILLGDALERLAEIPDGSVQCCVTSPPYWGLRDYRNEGQLGLESTPDAYVENLLALFREVRRILADDGVLWLNLGDSYSGSGKGPAGNLGAKHNERHMEHVHSAIVPDGLKPKDLVGIPWRVAFALQADGWWLRQDIIWHKPNPMPESVTDRCTKAHEYLFMLTKSQHYFFDNEAIREDATSDTDSEQGKRNKRSVWSVPVRPFRGAHFAVMPESLVEPCIRASTPEAGHCANCGKPHQRVIERGEIPERRTRDHTLGVIPGRNKTTRLQSVDMLARPKTTIGWQPTCDCTTTDTRPSVVMDPFTGSGTVAVVALSLGRHFIGTEINPDYAELAHNRIIDDRPLLNTCTINTKDTPDAK